MRVCVHCVCVFEGEGGTREKPELPAKLVLFLYTPTPTHTPLWLLLLFHQEGNLSIEEAIKHAEGVWTSKKA